MKNATPETIDQSSQVLDIRQPEHAARLSEAFAAERQKALTALAELETMRFGDKNAREQTALVTMEPMPGHELMRRAPQEVLRLRAAMFLVSYHAHRQN